MNEMEKLITQFLSNKYPGAEGINLDEIPALTAAIRRRLNTSSKDLDFTPGSLSVLSRALTTYHANPPDKNLPFSAEENIQIIREITGYLVEVFLRNYGGNLDNRGGLLGVSVAKDGLTEAVKGNEIRTSKRRAINLGLLAARYWNAIRQGTERRDLYELYKLVTPRRIKESLHRK